MTCDHPSCAAAPAVVVYRHAADAAYCMNHGLIALGLAYRASEPFAVDRLPAERTPHE